MDASLKQWGAVGASLLVGAGGGGGGILAHQRAITQDRTAAIQKLLEDTRQECRESREALGATFSESYSALQQMCLARCR